jgi:two-component SAPR family response regulator
LKVIIIDDEPFAIEGLRYELSQFKGMDVVKTYSNGKDFLQEYSLIKPELIFLDIEMPILNGFEVLARLMEMWREELPKIVFVTAYPDYALQAFEVNALDYIVKPVSPKRLEKTLGRILPGFKSTETREASTKLQIRTFGHFGVYSEGKEVPLKWRSKKAEELFLYLLLHKGHFVSKEKIVGDIWPELGAERGFSNLYLSLYYIKQTIKNAGIPLVTESMRGKIRILMDNVNCDFMIFEELIHKMNGDDTKSQTEKMEDLCKIYEGPFLDGYYLEWNESARNFYETQMMKYMEHGGYLEKQ